MSTTQVSLAMIVNHSIQFYRNFIKKYKNEICFFLAAFIVIFFTTKLSNSGSHENVEQWMNITNQMFYGNQDFLFSYGPLYWLTGHVTTQFSETTYWIALFFISIVNSIFWTLLYRLIYKSKSYLFFIIAFVLFLKGIVLTASFFMWPFILVVFIEFSAKKDSAVKNTLSCVLLGSLVAFFFYVRFFYGLFGVVIIGSYLFSNFIFRKQLSNGFYFLLSLLISYILLGFLIFHDGVSIINYLKINSQLSFGNSVDMTLDVKNTTSSVVSVVLIFLSLNLYVFLNKRNNLFITINIIFLLLLKLGFGRTDHYFSYFVVPIAIISLVMIFDKSLINKSLFLLVMLCLFTLANYPAYQGATPRAYLSKGMDFNDSFNKRMMGVYSEFKLRNEILKEVGKSTIDIYPYNNEYAFANNLNYVHRPLFQNYMTLTPVLDAMNEAFFNSKERPDFVLWTAGITCAEPDCNPFDGFDLKYSLNEDPATSMAIMSNYHPVILSTGINNTPVMLFKSNNASSSIKEEVISKKILKFNQWYPTPVANGGLIKIKPEFEFTLLGRIKNMLFRGNILKITYRLTDGQEITYRVNILNASGGILISPLLDKFDSAGFVGKRVESFMFETASSYYFKDSFSARFIHFSMPALKVTKPYSDEEILTPVSIIDSMVCQASIDIINSEGIANRYIKVSRKLSVNGWLALSVEEGSLFEKTVLTLRKGDNERRLFVARVEPRPDVSVHFKKENLSNSGFKSVINVSEMKGEYIIGLAGISNGKMYNCKNINISVKIN